MTTIPPARFKGLARRQPSPERGQRPLIGLMGRARAGKDTVAARLVERHGFVRHSFADALKRAALAADPIVVPIDTVQGSARLSDVVCRVGWEGAKEYREVRRLLQNFGMGIRAIDEDFWVRAALHPADYEARPVVITDVRFPNEARAIADRGGALVRVTRPGIAEDTHVSETALADWPASCTICNEGDLDALNVAVDHLAGQLLDSAAR